MPIDCSDLDQLAEDARCWAAKFDQQQLQAAIAYLTCQAANAGGGSAPVDIYWYNNSTAAGNPFTASFIIIDVLAIAGVETDITGNLTGWTGAETAALLAAEQAGKQVRYNITGTVTGVPTTPGASGNFQLRLNFGGDMTFQQANATVRITCSLDPAETGTFGCDFSYEITVDYGTKKASMTGMGIPRCSSAGVPLPRVVMESAAPQTNSTPTGLIYVFGANPTNMAAFSLNIRAFQVTVLNP